LEHMEEVSQEMTS